MLLNISLKCRTITPLFMFGADGTSPELRPSEFKGLMRWWWRALKGEGDIKKLKEEEAKIFGGSGESEGKSKVKIKVVYDFESLRKGIEQNLKEKKELNWSFNRKNRTLDGTHSGIGYLLYSTILPGKEKSFIKEDFEFEIVLEALNEFAFKNAVSALWASIYLGGFGTRARRGGGNIEVIESKGSLNDLLPKFELKADDASSVAQFLMKNFKRAKEMISGSPAFETFVSSYSNLSFSRFLISSQGFSSWIDALSDIGKIYSDFRYRKRGDIFEVGAFGLPVVHRRGQLTSKRYNRRSSPLIFKILKSKEKYYWLVLRLFGEFLPEGTALKFNEKTQKPDYKLIDEFWNELKKKGKEDILSEPQILEKIKNELIKQCNPSKIILFGSKARGDAHKNSDIDLAIETNRPIEPLDLNAPCDILLLNKASKELLDRIKREGVLLYERKS